MPVWVLGMKLLSVLCKEGGGWDPCQRQLQRSCVKGGHKSCLFGKPHPSVLSPPSAASCGVERNPIPPALGSFPPGEGGSYVPSDGNGFVTDL